MVPVWLRVGARERACSPDAGSEPTAHDLLMLERRHDNRSDLPPLRPVATLRFQPQHLGLTSTRAGDRHTIRVLGDLDLATAPLLTRELRRAEATGVASIVVDLSGVDFMDLAGVRVLSDAATRAQGWRLTLVPGRAEVQRVVELSGLADVLPFAAL
jgi:anti-anti-sigma factor